MSDDRDRCNTWAKGRGSSSNPTPRFDRLAYTPDPGEEPGAVPTQYFVDASRSILTDNESPDVELHRGLNVYRGCSHGCSYCYARPTHEYLGLSAGLDFESKIFVKPDAPALLRAELMRPSYRPVPIALSGITDPYQPGEKQFRLTRQCLEVLAEFRHPVCMITKGAMIERDADVLADLASHGCAWATISLTTLDASLQRRLEPRASTPRARLAAIERLTKAGVPVGVNVSPIIPGLTEHEIPSILKAAAEAGARRATWVLLRLPYVVKEVFSEWLEEHEPRRKDRVLSALTQLHGGKLYNSEYGKRLRGEGPLADTIKALFDVHCRRNGLVRDKMSFNSEAFFRPAPDGQQDLFTPF